MLNESVKHDTENQIRIGMHNTIQAHQNAWVWTCHVYADKYDTDGCRYICRDSEQCRAIVYNANAIGMVGCDIELVQWHTLDDGNMTIDARNASTIE